MEKKYERSEKGILALMYHRFDENKYPSTNIRMDIFKKQIEIIKNNNLQFINPRDFKDVFGTPKLEKKILITIDDGFLSFYENAWPFLKEEKIPFILFVSTQFVGKSGYMNWDQIKEVEKEEFAFIGNHSDSHEYLVEYKFNDFIEDIKLAINSFEKNLGYNPIFFSYPFGEYSLEQKKYISENFDFAFGQHSGVIDLNKDPFELPRFPINENYGNLERFEFTTKLLPLQFFSIEPEDKLILKENDPPKVSINFFEEQKNLNLINCFSNDGGNWNKTDLQLIDNKLNLNFKDKFNFRRGRVNCSLQDSEGWRWLGLQFSIN